MLHMLHIASLLWWGTCWIRVRPEITELRQLGFDVMVPRYPGVGVEYGLFVFLCCKNGSLLSMYIVLMWSSLSIINSSTIFWSCIFLIEFSLSQSWSLSVWCRRASGSTALVGGVLQVPLRLCFLSLCPCRHFLRPPVVVPLVLLHLVALPFRCLSEESVLFLLRHLFLFPSVRS